MNTMHGNSNNMLDTNDNVVIEATTEEITDNEQDNLSIQVESNQTTVTTSTNLLSNFKAFDASSSSRAETLSVSIVNTTVSGKRITISKGLFNALEQPDKLAFTYNDDKLAIGKELPADVESYKFAPSLNKHVLYRASLVETITEQFKLDFSTKSTITFSNILIDSSFVKEDKTVIPVAIITMR